MSSRRFLTHVKNKTCPFCGTNVFWLKVGKNWELFSLLNGPHICDKKVTTEGKYNCIQCGGFGVIELGYKKIPCYKCLYKVL
jgi:hypothetical protein